MAKKKKPIPSKRAGKQPPKSKSRVKRKTTPQRKVAKRSKPIKRPKVVKRPFWQNTDGSPKWLKKDGSLNQKYKKVTKYLTKTGKIRKNVKLPFDVKRTSTLFERIYNPKYPPWYTKDGKVRKSMLKYLTKKGELRKGVKLPKGIRSISGLWKLVKAKAVRRKEQVDCEDKTTAHFMVYEEILEDWDNYVSVFMDGKKVTKSYFYLHGMDYIRTIALFFDPNTGEKLSPPSATYTICTSFDDPRYKYVFV